jgi:hypothetical protein
VIAAGLAGFRSDGVSDQKDLLDIKHDVEALCSVIAARDVEPPLSIGLFGDWGSGKSFFIEEMKKRLRQIEQESDAAEQVAIAAKQPIAGATRYWARITQLEFNAWRYIDTELWASLGDGIMDGLARALEKPTIGEADPTARARLLAAAARSRDVIGEAEARKRTAEDNLAQQEQVLQQAKERARAPKRGRAAIRQEGRILAVAADRSLRTGLTKVREELGADPMVREAEATLLDLAGGWGTVKATWRAIRGNTQAALIGAVALAAVAYGVVALREYVDAAVRWLVAGGIAIATVIAGLRPYIKKAVEAVARVKKLVTEHGEALEKARAEAVQAEEDKRKRLETDVKEADRGLTQARRDLEQLEAQLLTLRADVQMAQFVKERQASDDYRKHLGVIARARSDFERLSELLFRNRDADPKEGLPRIDRIVLYIDDLDRCDEAQVVKVLQAVHLLLAFKLFVVVVAVDSRWLLHSLQQHSTAFQASAPGDHGISDGERLHWESTPLNYLEKIFQIPFTLPPVDQPGFESLIDHLTEPQADGSAAGATRSAQDTTGAVDAASTPGAVVTGTTEGKTAIQTAQTSRAADGATATPAAGSVRSPEVNGADAAHAPASSANRPAASPAVPAQGAANAPASVTNQPAALPAVPAQGAANAPASPANQPAASPAVPAPGAAHAPVSPANQLIASPAVSASGAANTRASPPAASASGAANAPASQAGRPASGTAPSATAPATRIDVTPPHLVIESWERSFLKEFHELIATPRAVKRFVNVYRLLKARVPAGRAAAFLGDASGGEHRAAIFLLAVLIGSPSEATDMMRALIEEPPAGEWWSWLTGFLAGKTAEAPGSARHERWHELASRLAEVRRRFEAADVPLPTADVFQYWTPYVARFSFQAGRLSAKVRDPVVAAQPSAPEVAAHASAPPTPSSKTAEPRDPTSHVDLVPPSGPPGALPQPIQA